jgi:hypothetical protein
MTYYRIFTVEHTGLNDTTTVKADKPIEEAKAEYIKMRISQSQKGFKIPVPKEVTIQYGY